MRKVFLLLLSAFFVSCVRDKPQPPTSSSIAAGSKTVLILNEGNFGSSNASLSLFDPETGALSEDAYKEKNGTSIGDVLQSLASINRKYYFVVNNSGKIVVTDRSLRRLAEIPKLRSPRYICQANAVRAYVSDLYANGLHVLDLSTNMKTGFIPCNGWTEQMLTFDDRTFVCNLRKEYLYVIRHQDDRIGDSVWVGEGAAGLALDKNEKLWVLCGGDALKNSDSRLSRIDPRTLKTEFTTTIKGAGASRLCANQGRDTLYFLFGDVFRMAIGDPTVPASAFIPANQRNFYGLAVDPDNSEIYVSDALDFSQRSNVYRFSAAGLQKQVLKAGINTSDFFFE